MIRVVNHTQNITSTREIWKQLSMDKKLTKASLDESKVATIQYIINEQNEYMHKNSTQMPSQPHPFMNPMDNFQSTKRLRDRVNTESQKTNKRELANLKNFGIDHIKLGRSSKKWEDTPQSKRGFSLTSFKQDLQVSIYTYCF